MPFLFRMILNTLFTVLRKLDSIPRFVFYNSTHMNTKIFILALVSAIALSSCKKEGCTDEAATNYNSKAKKDDGSCEYPSIDPAYTIPTTYSFNDGNGNSTVSFSGQTERLNQLDELITKIKTGRTGVLSAQDLQDMFANTGGNGNGNFSFSSTKQLRDKAFSLDVTMIETLLNDAATASLSNASAASDGQAGVLTSGTSSYLFDANGRDMAEMVEKSVMGAVFMYQALNVYFGDGKMNVDNTTAVNAGAGEYYTAMEHHWDEAFGYFGVDINFPAVAADRFWGEYCQKQNATLNSNADMMNNFLKGRAAIGGNIIADRDAAITAIRTEWEDISANQAIAYLNSAIGYFGNDDAKFLHALTEVYGFAWNLRYAADSTRRMSISEHADLMNLFGTNFWSLTVSDLNTIKSTIQAKY